MHSTVDKAGQKRYKGQEKNLALVRRRTAPPSSIKIGEKEDRLGTGEGRIICLVGRRVPMG